MAWQRLSTAPVLTIVLVAVLAAGCAAKYPPSGQPLPPATQPGPEAPGAMPGAEPGATPREHPAEDARAPTLALLRQSERSADDGDLDSAIAYVERAIRLNSRDPALWLRLARLQLAADRPAAAEQLAHKALALTASDDTRQREAWLLVADALEAQGDDEAAETIRARWRTYRG